MPSLLRSLIALLRAWWKTDRVRASIADGRLLRLEPGSALRVNGRPALIVRRRVGQTPGGAYVAYECTCAEGPAELLVRCPGGKPSSKLRWSRDGTCLEIAPEAVAAYPARRRGRYNEPR